MSLLQKYNAATAVVHGVTWPVQAQLCIASCEPTAIHLCSSGTYGDTEDGGLLKINDPQYGEC